MSGSYKSPRIYSKIRNSEDDFVPLDDNLITILGVLGALPLVAIIIYYMYTYYQAEDNSRQNLVK